jgi:dolichyl-phosphate-mannose--protein O-mannosyl transferase
MVTYIRSYFKIFTSSLVSVITIVLPSIAEKILDISAAIAMVSRRYAVKTNISSGIVSTFTLGINARKAISIFLGLIIGLLIIIYIFALFASFNYGLVIQERDKIRRELQQSLIAEELKARKLQTDLWESHKDEFNSMEKISKMRYITFDNFADASAVKSR